MLTTDLGSGFFFHTRSRGKKSTGSRILDPQHWYTVYSNVHCLSRLFRTACTLGDAVLSFWNKSSQCLIFFLNIFRKRLHDLRQENIYLQNVYDTFCRIDTPLIFDVRPQQWAKIELFCKYWTKKPKITKEDLHCHKASNGGIRNNRWKNYRITVNCRKQTCLLPY